MAGSSSRRATPLNALPASSKFPRSNCTSPASRRASAFTRPSGCSATSAVRFSSRTRGDKKRQKSLDIFFGYHKIEAPKSDSLGLRRSLVDNERHTSNSSSSHGCDSQCSYQSWSCCCVCSQLLLRNSDNLNCVLDSNVFGGRVARPAEETAVFFLSLFFGWILALDVPHWPPHSEILGHSRPF